MTAANTCASASTLGVRWDAVAAPCLRTAVTVPALAPPDLGQSTESIQVHVQLFGALAALCAQRSVRLETSRAATIAEVLVRAEQRLDAPLLTHMMDETGVKRRHCRLFVGGYAVEDLQTPLPATTSPTEIDIILLIAPEGG